MVAHPRRHFQAGVDGGRELGAGRPDRVVLFRHLAVFGHRGRRRPRHEASLQVPELGDVGGGRLEIVGRQGPAQAVDCLGPADRRSDVGQRLVDPGLGDIQLAHLAGHAFREGACGGDAGGQGLGVSLEGAEGLGGAWGGKKLGGKMRGAPARRKTSERIEGAPLPGPRRREEDMAAPPRPPAAFVTTRALHCEAVRCKQGRGRGGGAGQCPRPCVPCSADPDPSVYAVHSTAARPAFHPTPPHPDPRKLVIREWATRKAGCHPPAPSPLKVASHLTRLLCQAGQVSLQARARGKQGLELTIHALLRARHIHQGPAHFRQAGQLAGRAQLQGGGRVKRRVGHVGA